MTMSETQQQPTMSPEPQKEHQWLQQLVGEWSSEMEMEGAEPGKPAEKVTGTEIARSIGGLWVQVEGHGEVPGGDTDTIMTLGFDPQRQRFVGTFIGSMMTHMWVYDGGLDAAGRVLTLDCEGPSLFSEGKMAPYQDVIEFKSDDHRVLTSRTLGDDGKWHHFMTANYYRTKHT